MVPLRSAGAADVVGNVLTNMTYRPQLPTVMTWIILAITVYSEKQRKCQEELERVVVCRHSEIKIAFLISAREALRWRPVPGWAVTKLNLSSLGLMHQSLQVAFLISALSIPVTTR